LETERTVQDQYLNTLEDVVTCYNSNTSSCNTTAVTLPITQITATTTLGSVKSQNNTNINSYGLPTEVDQYGYGSGSPGGLIRKILTTYNTSLTNIYDRASVVQTKDNGGTIQAHRTYSYNSTGNLTGESIYTVGSTTVSRTLTPNTYGVLTASTDFNSHSTTYGGFTCGGSTAFPTTITTGSLTTTLGWSCDGGVVTSVQDANGKTTSINYNTTTNHNNFWGRVVEVDYPDGGVNTTTYTDTTGAFNVVNSALVRSGVSHQTTQLLDSLGRVYQAQDNSAASYVDTTYDSLGRVASVSNPYYSVSDPSYGVTSYSYDPLNRLSDEGTTKAITRPDGNKVSMTYSSNSASLSFCSTVGDEAGKVRTICTDALGRTTSVTEDPSPGLNYQTTYAYDVMNNLTGVAQGSQTRTYVYDMASRITQATTPESGRRPTLTP